MKAHRTPAELRELAVYLFSYETVREGYDTLKAAVEEYSAELKTRHEAALEELKEIKDALDAERLLFRKIDSVENWNDNLYNRCGISYRFNEIEQELEKASAAAAEIRAILEDLNDKLVIGDEYMQREMAKYKEIHGD